MVGSDGDFDSIACQRDHALVDCRVTAIPFTAIDKLSDEGRAEVLRRAGEELAGRMRLGGDASAMAARRARALGQFVVSVMTLQCVYAIAVTAIPFAKSR